MILLVVAASRPEVGEDSVTVYGVVSSLVVVGLVLTFLVSLGFLMGILLRRPLLAVVILVFVWYPIGFVLSVFSLEQFSPISLNQGIYTQLRRPCPLIGTDEEEEASAVGAEDITGQLNNLLKVFSVGASEPAPRKQQFFEKPEFEDFSLFSVILGYGLPTLATVMLAAFCFHRRDL